MYRMSGNSVMGHGGDNPHDEEGHPEVSSHQEGGDSIGPSEIPEGAGGNMSQAIRILHQHFIGNPDDLLTLKRREFFRR